MANESTPRVLSLDLCNALRALRVDVPELYLDQGDWQVNLLVMKIDVKMAPPLEGKLKRHRKQHERTSMRQAVQW